MLLNLIFFSFVDFSNCKLITDLTKIFMSKVNHTQYFIVPYLQTLLEVRRFDVVIRESTERSIFLVSTFFLLNCQTNFAPDFVHV